MSTPFAGANRSRFGGSAAVRTLSTPGLPGRAPLSFPSSATTTPAARAGRRLWQIRRMPPARVPGSPSLRHQLVAWAVPRLRRLRRARRRGRRAGPARALARRARPVPADPVGAAFDRRFSVGRDPDRPGGDFPAYVVTPRGTAPARTVVYLHGGGFVAPIDPFHVRYAAPAGRGAGRPGGAARLPAGPRAHLARLPRRARRAWSPAGATSPAVVLAGDSAGGGSRWRVALRRARPRAARSRPTCCCTRPGST